MLTTSEDLEVIALSHGVNVEFLGQSYAEMRSALDNRLGGLAVAAVNESEQAVARYCGRFAASWFYHDSPGPSNGSLAAKLSHMDEGF